MRRFNHFSQKIPLLCMLSALLIVTGCKPQNDTAEKNKNQKRAQPVKRMTDLTGLEYASVTELSALLKSQKMSSRMLVSYLLQRIDSMNKKNHTLNAVIEVNPDALALADQLDLERRNGKIRGPLHGIPIMLKDNIDTGDRMQTTAGSLALVGEPALQDAFLVKKLRDAGAIIIAKNNLSEWAAYRDSDIPAGWSARNGQTKNPHLLTANPCGSSSGSAVAVAAGFAPISIGTETNGSITCPAKVNGVVGMRPTLGLVSRSGIIPISHAQDTAGPIAQHVKDVALTLTVLAGRDSLDPDTAEAQTHAIDYTTFLKADGLKGQRIGYPKSYDLNGTIPFEKSLAKMREQGAILIPIEPLEINPKIFKAQKLILAMDFKRELNLYLLTRKGLKVKSLADIIAFNKNNPGMLPNGKIAQQKTLELAENTRFDPVLYQQHYDQYKAASRQAIDIRLSQNQLDALVDDYQALGLPAIAGYPGISVPNGINQHLPTAVYFYGTRWSDAKLLSMAYSFEQAIQAPMQPKFLAKQPKARAEAANLLTESSQ